MNDIVKISLYLANVSTLLFSIQVHKKQGETL